MYSHDELSRLEAHKNRLRLRIAARRLECGHALAGVVQPLAWLDRAVIFWRKVSPLAKFAALPLALVTKRMFFPRAKLLGSLFRWGPVAWGVARSFSSPRR